MRRRDRSGYTVAVMLAAAMAGTALHAQGTTSDDAKWLDECRNHWGGVREPQLCDLRVARIARYTGPLRVDGGRNGGVEVIGWDGDSVVVHTLVVARATTENDARDLAGQVTIVTTNGSIHAEGPANEHHASWSANFRVYVPRHSDLSLATVNGPVSVQGVTARIDMHAINGPVSLDHVGGDVHASAENGPLEIALVGSRWDGAGLDAETRNGPVELTMPEHYAAHLETGTVNGPMDIGFPVTVQGSVNMHRLSLDIGGGGPVVRVVTTNGPVTVRHASSSD